MAKLINFDIPALEILLLIIFIFYLIFQVKTPNMLIDFVNSNLGMIIILIITVYLFLFTNPILGVLSIFVVYELIRRSSISLANSPTYVGGSTRMYNPQKIINDIDDKPFHSILGLPNIVKNKNIDNISQPIPNIQYTQNSDVRTIEMHNMNPTPEVTLEEEVVTKLAPIGQSQSSGYIETSFKPISENIYNASLV
jgi:hypothetical protein